MGWTFGRVALRVVVGCVLLFGGARVGFGQIVINEFIPNPAVVTDANGEWLELYNAGGSQVDIVGWTIKDDGSNSHVIATANGTTTIAAGGYLVLGANDDSTVNGGVTVNYDYSSFSLGNGEDEIVLVDDSSTEQDRVDYARSAWESIASGVAFALKATDLDNNIGGNWCLATTSYGDNTGTPGAANDCPTTPDDFTGPIYDIQGSGAESPKATGKVTTNDNIVTAVGAGGFFIQTPTAASDNNADTSDGIFVLYDGTTPINVGDQVDVTGMAEEFFAFTRINATTSVTGASVTLDASNQTLPDPVEFGATVPSPDPASPSCAIEYECYEGMRIRIATGTVGSGSQYFGSDPVAEMYITPTASRAFREKGLAYPGDTSNTNLPVWDTNPEVFELDPNKLRDQNESWVPGTTFSATGVLGYEFGSYEIWPIELRRLTTGRSLPRPARQRRAGEVSVASLNMLNLNGSTQNYAMKLTKLSRYIREVLRSPDVIGVQEVNTIEALTGLADRIRTDDPSVNYAAYLEEGPVADRIDNGFLVRAGVTVDAVTQHNKNEMYLNPTTNNNEILNDRPPLQLDASVEGIEFSVLVIHNRSLIGVNTDRVQVKRLEQAQSVARLAQSLQRSKLIIVGDYNAYQFTDGYVDVVGQIAGNITASENKRSGADLVDPNLSNLVLDLPESDRYSYVFDGNAQALDHALVNDEMADSVVEMQYARGNADAAEGEERNANSVLYASDHDGFVVYLEAPGRPAAPSPGVGGDPEPEPEPEADLDLDAESQIVSATKVRYSVNVENAGPDPARNVAVMSSFSGGGSMDASTSGCEEDPDGVPECGLGDIAVGDSASFTIDVDTGGASEMSLTYSGTIVSDTMDPKPRDDDVDVVQPLGPPNAPSELVATAVGSTEIELRWTDNSGVETAFDIFLQGPGDSKLRPIESVPANMTSTVVTELVPGETYSFAVVAVNEVLRSEPTAESTATTWADANLRIAAEGRILSEELVRYAVSVRNAGPQDAPNVVVTSSLMAADGAFVTSTSGCREDPGGVPGCSLDDVEVGESQSFTVDVEIDAASRNSLVYAGAVTDVADPRPHDDKVEIPLLLGRPEAPSDLVATVLSETEIKLQWRDNSDLETAFAVFLQGPGDAKLRMIGTVPADTTSMVVNELVPSTTYSFAVEAVNAVLHSELTPKSTATTLTADAARCGEDDALCLGVFQVEVEWDDGKGRAGRGFAERLTADAGDFWFFHPANIELVVKVLDGCAMNDHYWVYAAGLTDVGVTMTVRDLRSGLERRWTNPLGTRFRPITDASAFATCGTGSKAHSQDRIVLSGAPRRQGEELYAASLSSAELVDSASSVCTADDTSLCLLGSRFRVRADWKAGERSGAAASIPRTADTGMFWFLSSNNVELVVKVLDGCSENGYRWVLMGGLTDVGVEVTVTDGESGRAKMYRSLEGMPFATMFDATAFDCTAGP